MINVIYNNYNVLLNLVKWSTFYLFSELLKVRLSAQYVAHTGSYIIPVGISTKGF